MYSSYTAASFPRKLELADRHGVNLEGALTWAFEFEDQPYFAGFRVLASNGIDLPVLNVFRMFSRMSGNRLAVSSDAGIELTAILKDGVRAKPDISAVAVMESNQVCVLIWHYHDDDLPGPSAEISLNLEGLSFSNQVPEVSHFRIDDEYSNAFAAWRKMGSPPNPTPEQYRRLEAAGQLARMEGTQPVSVKSETTHLAFKLPRQCVSLITLTWKKHPR